jgi:hypothetical protein
MSFIKIQIYPQLQFSDFHFAASKRSISSSKGDANVAEMYLVTELCKQSFISLRITISVANLALCNGKAI